MSDGKKYYCFCGSNCKYETMTKEQIMAAIAQAVETGSVGDVDTGFVSRIKEKNGGSVTFWVGTQAQYNALAAIESNCLYIITDDTATADMNKAIATALETAEAALQAASERYEADAYEYKTAAIHEITPASAGVYQIVIVERDSGKVPVISMGAFSVGADNCAANIQKGSGSCIGDVYFMPNGGTMCLAMNAPKTVETYLMRMD